MKMSPCQRHRARIKAKQALDNREALAGTPVSFHLKMLELKNDVERLRSILPTAERIEMKRAELLPRWLPSVEAYLAGDKRHPNPAFVYCVIWLLDTGEMEKALEWADIAISENQPMPDNFKSTLPTFIADTVLAWTIEQADAGHSIEPFFSRTFAAVRERKWPLHDDVSAKWFKFAGLDMLRDEKGQPRATAVDDVATLEEADALLAQAEAFNKNVGVRTMRQKIAARIKGITGG
jgi:hypothetical protein